jgi:hypothetical protein
MLCEGHLHLGNQCGFLVTSGRQSAVRAGRRHETRPHLLIFASSTFAGETTTLCSFDCCIPARLLVPELICLQATVASACARIHTREALKLYSGSPKCGCTTCICLDALRICPAGEGSRIRVGEASLWGRGVQVLDDKIVKLSCVSTKSSWLVRDETCSLTCL